MAKKIFGVILIIIGAICGLVTGILCCVEINMFLHPQYYVTIVGNVMLLAILFLLFLILGILPIFLGIKLIKASSTNKKIAKSGLSGQRAIATEEATELKEDSGNIPDELTFSDLSKKRLVFRDKQFDNGDWPLIMLLIDSVLAALIPIVVCICVDVYVNRFITLGGPNAIYFEWLSLLVIVLGALAAILGMRYAGKRRAIGNRFNYFIYDENDGLSYAYFGSSRILSYLERNVTLKDKFKNRPSLLYTLIFILSDRRSGNAIRFARLQNYFLVNKDKQLVEKLFISDGYQNYCDKIVGVKNLSYTPDGLKATIVTIRNDYEFANEMIIYRNTEQYEVLAEKLKAFSDIIRVGDELSQLQMAEVRQNIIRRMGYFILGVSMIGLCALFFYRFYLVNAQEAYSMKQGVFQFLKIRLATRAYRQYIGAVTVVVLLIFSFFAKMVADLFSTKNFTCISAKVHCYKKGKPLLSLRKIDMTYPYYAEVSYADGKVSVGVGKATYAERENVKPVLVLRKGIPYCLVKKY